MKNICEDCEQPKTREELNKMPMGGFVCDGCLRRQMKLVRRGQQ